MQADELRRLAKGLRRELKQVDGPAAAWSHAQWLEVLARACGKHTWAELLATPESAAPPPAATVESYPLSNADGRFSFVRVGQVVTGTFEPVSGTLDDLPYCLAQASSANHGADGLDPNYEGSTEVNWDEQTTRRDHRGVRYWLTKDWQGVPEDQLLLLPEGVDPQAVLDGTKRLPVRPALVTAYVNYLRQTAPRPSLAEAENELGFCLTPAEAEAVQTALE